MILKLKTTKWINALVALPETGMGYQIVDITLKDNRIMNKIKVFNCEIVDLPVGYESVCENDIAQIQC